MHMEVIFYDEDPIFILSCQEGKFNQGNLLVQIFKEAHLETQVWGMVHILWQLAPIFFNVDVLFAHRFYIQWWLSRMDITKWLPLFHLFPTVEVMCLSGRVGVYIADALKNTAEEMDTKVLPALCLIKLTKDECDNEDLEVDHDYWNDSRALVERFPFLHQFSGCPVTILSLEDEFAEAEWSQ